MRLSTTSAVLALSLAATACGQGSSDNVMSPEANALDPADVNSALGPEVANTPDLNATDSDVNGSDVDEIDNGPDVSTNAMNSADDEPEPAFPPDEPSMNNSSG